MPSRTWRTLGEADGWGLRSLTTAITKGYPEVLRHLLEHPVVDWAMVDAKAVTQMAQDVGDPTTIAILAAGLGWSMMYRKIPLLSSETFTRSFDKDNYAQIRVEDVESDSEDSEVFENAVEMHSSNSLLSLS